MKPLNRETLGAELRARLIERHGSLTAAAEALHIDIRQLYRAYSKHGDARESLVAPLRILRRLGCEVHFTIEHRANATGATP